MSKSYNTDVVKFASKIRKRNQGMIDDYAKAQQKQALIGSIGNAISGIAGAYGQAQQLKQQQAASQQIGAMPELGLTPDVAGQIAPNQLLSAALQIRARNQGTPLNALQQAELDYKKAQLAQMPDEQRREAELASAAMEANRAQAEASRALAQDRLRAPPRIPVKIGADGQPVLTEGSYDVDPADALRLASGGGASGDRYMKVTVREGDPYHLAGLPLGEHEIPASAFTAGINQSGLSDRSTDTIKARKDAAEIVRQTTTAQQRSKMIVDLTKTIAELEAQSAGDVTDLIGNQVSGAKSMFGADGYTLPDFKKNAEGVVPQRNTQDLREMLKLLQDVDAPTLPGAGSPPPSAAPPSGPTATGPNGEKVMWNGTEWTPVK